MDANTFKDTVNLPITDMPMKAGLINIEPNILSNWTEQKIYQTRQKANAGNTPFILHDGPPYPNGNIHLGHALNKILKDIIIKYHLIKGHDTPYVPGWDCHGLPIETQLLKDLKKKEVLDDEVHSFREQCRDYALKFVDLQKSQFDRLGIWGDFEHPYLTLTPEYEKAVIELFGKMADAGLVYQGKKPIHWCGHCKTALAEAEIEYSDERSSSVYVRFPLVDAVKGHKKVSLIVWTTTPWTLPANVAVAVHPDFDYVVVDVAGETFLAVEALIPKLTEKLGWGEVKTLDRITGKQLEGQTYTHPFINRVSPVVCAHYVSSEDGSGLVHIAPGHGYEDFMVGQAYKLPTIMPVDEKGVFTDEAGKYAGLAVRDANKVIIADLEELGKLLKLEYIQHSYPHCWRCGEPVIFRATEQWFIAMDSDAQLRNKALAAIKDVKWYPDWGQKRITSMVDGRPDWCISRQRFWGIPIPVFYCEKCKEPHFTGPFNKAVVEMVAKHGTNGWFSQTAAQILPKTLSCSKCGHGVFEKDKNIMDVWLESGASHHAVLDQTKGLHYPADLYLEGSDQHRGWFQSSLLTAVGANGSAPYKAVLTHGFTIDEKGQKMSKSKGNVIDPLKVISIHGADILRLWVGSTDFTNDVILSENIVGQVKDAFTKIRNTLRFLMSNIHDFDENKDSVKIDSLLDVDQWILAKLNLLIDKVDGFYQEYELHQIYHSIYNFCVIELSAFYLDIQKDNLYCNGVNSPARRSCQTALSMISRSLIVMLSPILAFSMEDVYRYLPGQKKTSVFLETYPSAVKIKDQSEVLQRFEALLQIRVAVNAELEKLRQTKVIGSSLEAAIVVTTPSALTVQELEKVLVVSRITIQKGETFSVTVSKAEGEKCLRCWKYADLTPEGLCPRCHGVL